MANKRAANDDVCVDLFCCCGARYEINNLIITCTINIDANLIALQVSIYDVFDILQIHDIIFRSKQIAFRPINFFRSISPIRFLILNHWSLSLPENYYLVLSVVDYKMVVVVVA
ncbi:hypothetical protein DERP_012018 [Dermatophagoides pteronyssinus]|uniref:Uncharacterized protein n=1 Tax=Dermatophagoides pteronyssinus TaxID=6956 RepID=A0ABQ8IVQ7_DERPT|nr:hypothetical protein DERP_012018 [Dermatophagoides pteronyssinus]